LRRVDPALFRRGADRHPTRFAGLGHRNGQREHAAVEVRLELVRIEVVAEKELPGQLAIGSLVNENLVPFLARRPAGRSHVDHVALNGQLEILRRHPRQIDRDDELVAAPESLHRHRPGVQSARRQLLTKAIQLTKRIEAHQGHFLCFLSFVSPEQPIHRQPACRTGTHPTCTGGSEPHTGIRHPRSITRYPVEPGTR
jgi:hypothetical protein